MKKYEMIKTVLSLCVLVFFAFLALATSSPVKNIALNLDCFIENESLVITNLESKSYRVEYVAIDEYVYEDADGDRVSFSLKGNETLIIPLTELKNNKGKTLRKRRIEVGYNLTIWTNTFHSFNSADKLRYRYLGTVYY